MLGRMRRSLLPPVAPRHFSDGSSGRLLARDGGLRAGREGREGGERRRFTARSARARRQEAGGSHQELDALSQRFKSSTRLQRNSSRPASPFRHIPDPTLISTSVVGHLTECAEGPGASAASAASPSRYACLRGSKWQQEQGEPTLAQEQEQPRRQRGPRRAEEGDDLLCFPELK